MLCLMMSLKRWSSVMMRCFDKPSIQDVDSRDLQGEVGVHGKLDKKGIEHLGPVHHRALVSEEAQFNVRE